MHLRASKLSRSPRRLCRAFCPLFSLVLFTLLGACDDDDGPMGPGDPTVTITSPASGWTAFEGSRLPLQGSGSDPQDGPLPDSSLVWTSSIDGTLGTGSALEVSSPSVGIHTITLTARDSHGNQATASISVVIQELEFLDGTVSDPRVGLVVNSLSNAVRLFRVGDPDGSREIALGASSAVTATGLSVRGERAAVPLGNAASVAVIDLRSRQIEGFFLFPSGNATGSDFVDDQSVLAANQETDEVGKFSLGQASQNITETASVAPFPTDVITVSPSRVLVISANLDDNYLPAGEGVVTAIDPGTMTVTGTVETGGRNPQFGDLGPDGLLYVTNTGNYVDPSTLAIIHPETLTRVGLVEGFPAGSGHVHVDREGRAYVSGYFFGTVVWDSVTESFLRGPGDPVCAPLAGGGCRGASSAYTAADGTLYQTFFGSPGQGLAPWVFRYSPERWELADSVPSGLGPTEVEIHVFR